MNPLFEKVMLKMNNTTIYRKDLCNKEVEQLEHLDTITSGVFYTIQCLLVIPTVYVNILVLRMLKRDKFSIAVELKVNSCLYFSKLRCMVDNKKYHHNSD